jgi:hypothetical protein
MWCLSVSAADAWLVLTKQRLTAVTPKFSVLSGWVGLHASRTDTRDLDALAAAGFTDVPPDLPSGVVVGAAFLLSVNRDDGGRLAYSFSDAIAIDSIRCRGTGVRWRLDDAIERELRAAIAKHEARWTAGRAA